jgi:hypothetical protein
MTEILMTLARLLIVQEIQEDPSGAALRFREESHGRLALRDKTSDSVVARNLSDLVRPHRSATLASIRPMAENGFDQSPRKRGSALTAVAGRRAW